MKIKKTYLIIFILILHFSCIFQGNTTSLNNCNDKEIKNILPLISASNSNVNDWNRTWGGSDNDYGRGVAVDLSGDIYLTGDTWSYGAGDRDMVLVKYDRSGIQQWNRTWGGSNLDSGRGVIVDSSGNIFLAGYTDNFGAGGFDLVLVKYDSSGIQQWNKTWGGINDDSAWGVTLDSLDNVYIAGRTESFGEGGSDIILVKYDNSGVQQWNHTWGGSSLDFSQGLGIDSSDNIYLAGYTWSFGAGNDDIVLVKYDSSGVQQWNRTWGGGSRDYDGRVAVDSSDNVYLIGTTLSFGGGSYNIVIAKYDNSGIQLWNRSLGVTDDVYARGVAVDSSDNIYVTGYIDNPGVGLDEIILAKYSSSGELKSLHMWGGSNNDVSEEVILDWSDNVYIAGYTYSFGAGLYDMVLVKYNVEKTEKDQIISGYYLLVLFFVIGIITVISLKKRNYK